MAKCPNSKLLSNPLTQNPSVQQKDIMIQDQNEQDNLLQEFFNSYNIGYCHIFTQLSFEPLIKIPLF